MDIQSYMEIFNSLSETVGSVLSPVVLALLSAILLFAKKYAKKIINAFEAKLELDQLSKMNELKSQLLTEIEKMTKSAVATNMDIAKKMKENGNKLTDEQAENLNKTAIDLVMSSLPSSLTNEGGSLLNIIGGSDKLNTIIKSFIEQYVYEYKNKK